MPWKHAKSMEVHWWESGDPSAVSEAVVEVEFPNKSRKFLTVQILRVSNNFNTPGQLPANSVYREIAEDNAVPEDKVKANLNPPGTSYKAPDASKK
jgi:hypothetical protein